jgi:hypothetical protein
LTAQRLKNARWFVVFNVAFGWQKFRHCRQDDGAPSNRPLS